MAVQIKWGYNTPIQKTSWLWKPFIPYGKLTVLQGDPGEGKTSLILKIAAMVTQGQQPPTLKNGQLLDIKSIEPANVFYASTEEEIADSALPRFIRNGGDVNRFAYSAESAVHMNLTEEDIRSVVESTKAKLIIIDPLQAFLPQNISLTNITKLRPIFTALSNVAMETGAAIVLLGHMNKNEGAKDIHRGLGSADISASVRSIFTVEKDKNDRGLRLIHSVKSNFDESDFTEIGMRLDDNNSLYFIDLQEDGADDIDEISPIDAAKEYLIDLLSSGSVASSQIDELLEEHGISKRTANRAKKELGIKSVQCGGQWYWELSEQL